MNALPTSRCEIALRAPGYPATLADIPDPPAVLHVAGRLVEAPHVAIVGSRESSGYGRHVATQLAFELAAAGVVIVSGLARGIDAAAHRGALQAGGLTVAVLPGGLRPIYPRRHYRLGAEIAASGALVAEHEDGTEATPWRFPERNRIIAGLSMVVVVVEAAIRSGARITANFALEFGREVLVVPGPITSPTSAGCHVLMRQGAAPCTGSADVIAHLPASIADSVSALEVNTLPENLSIIERRLLEEIRKHASVALDHLVRHCNISAAQVMATIGALEIRGLIERLPGSLVAAARPCRP